MKINIMNDAQYRHLMELLNIRNSLNSWEEFELYDDNSVLIADKKVYAEFRGSKQEQNFFEIFGIRQEENHITIVLTVSEKSAILVEMPTEG